MLVVLLDILSKIILYKRGNVVICTLGMLRESCRVGIVVRFTSGMMMESFLEGVLLSVVPLTCQANLVQEGNVILCTMLRESCRMGIIVTCNADKII